MNLMVEKRGREMKEKGKKVIYMFQFHTMNVMIIYCKCVLY